MGGRFVAATRAEGSIATLLCVEVKKKSRDGGFCAVRLVGKIGDAGFTYFPFGRAAMQGMRGRGLMRYEALGPAGEGSSSSSLVISGD